MSKNNIIRVGNAGTKIKQLHLCREYRIQGKGWKNKIKTTQSFIGSAINSCVSVLLNPNNAKQ